MHFCWAANAVFLEYQRGIYGCLFFWMMGVLHNTPFKLYTQILEGWMNGKKTGRGKKAHSCLEDSCLPLSRKYKCCLSGRIFKVSSKRSCLEWCLFRVEAAISVPAGTAEGHPNISDCFWMTGNTSREGTRWITMSPAPKIQPLLHL